MAFARKRIAIIGGGFAGLVSIALLKEVGLESECFELTDKHGGTWCYREKSVEGVASTMPTTVINHSKELGALSTFPPRKEYNNFMRHSELYQYIMEFATEKDVLKHVRYNSEVILVQRAEDYKYTGKWVVTVKDTLTGKIATATYDGVMVCTGFLNRPKMPTFPGQDKFKGTIMHTHSLKGVSEFQNKNVVVVGMGCSALDAAVESTNVAKQVYLSTRSGAHVINRQGPNGYPYDYILLRRHILNFLNYFPPNFISWIIESFYLDPQFNHRLYTVIPEHHFLSNDPIMNDHIHSKLLVGSVIMKKDIERFTENGVIFKGEPEETKTDVVIMGTGYTWKFPFLEEGIVVAEDGLINLYKGIFPPHLEHSTLSIIGFLLPMGPGFPVGEMQIRWVSQVLAGNVQLPSKDKMYKDITYRYCTNVLRYKPDDRMSLRVDYMQYMDRLAKFIGAKPNLVKIFFTDIKLFLKLWFGPNLSYQYRLQGPHPWSGARDAIMTCDERLHWPLMKKGMEKIEENFLTRFVKKICKIVFQIFI